MTTGSAQLVWLIDVEQGDNYYPYILYSLYFNIIYEAYSSFSRCEDVAND